MNEKLLKFFNSTKKCLSKHSPEILVGIGITGMAGTVVMAVKATPKALALIEEEKARQNEQLVDEAVQNGYENCEQINKLKPLDVIRVAWKPYLPAAITGIGSAICIIGASAVNAKRNAALATAYALSERTLVKYRDKVIETIGEKKDKEIRNQIAQDNVKQNPVSKSEVIITSKGNTLCRDEISGRYFRSDIDKIKKVVNELNRQMIYQHYISLNDFYYELGLDGIKNGSALGWNLDQGLIEIDFGSCLTDDDEPCVTIDYLISPRYDYDKLM